MSGGGRRDVPCFGCAPNADDRVIELTQSGSDEGNVVTPKRVVFEYDQFDKTVTTSRYENGSLVVETSTVLSSPRLPGEASSDAAFLSIASITHTDASGNLLASHGYTYTPDGFVETHDNNADGLSEYDYDPTGQLTSADNETTDDETFAYDANGNQLQFTIGPNNQILSDGTYYYRYDADGNRRLKYQWTDTNQDGEVQHDERFDLTAYTWDSRGRLLKITTKPDGATKTQVVKYSYDYLNRRVEKKIKTFDSTGENTKAIERYSYLAEDIVLQRDRKDDLTHRYLHNPNVIDQCLADESLFEDIHGDPASNTLYLLQDNLGSTTDLVDYDSTLSLASVANHITYTSFGQVIAQTDPTITTLQYFTGQPYDPETGYTNHGARLYDPILATWLSEDPISFLAHDPNLYRYVGNNLVGAFDKTGLNYGHHWFPVAVARFFRDAGDLTDEAYLVAMGYYSGDILPTHNGRKLADISHFTYNGEVTTEFQSLTLSSHRP